MFRYSNEASAGMDPGANLGKEVIITIDADYGGEVGIILVNLSNENFVIEDGEIICQMIISRCGKVEWEGVDTHLDSERRIGGFGHTGKN